MPKKSSKSKIAGIAGGGNKINIGAAPNGTTHEKISSNTPVGTPPSGSGQNSGSVIHRRSSGAGIENMNGMAKTYSM